MQNQNLTLKKVTVKAEGYAYPTYRVSGWVNGRRIRKQFRSEHEAMGEKHRLEVFSVNAIDPIRPAITRLTPAQLAEAEVAYSRLGSKSLTAAVKWYIDTYREPNTRMLLADAVEAFMTDRKAYARPRVIGYYQKELDQFSAAHSKAEVHGITTEMIIAYLDTKSAGTRERKGVGAVRRNGLRRNLASFFNFCMKTPRRWVCENPVTPIPMLPEKYHLPKVLTVEQAEALMRRVETFAGVRGKKKPGLLVPYFALALFAGIRPAIDDGELIRLGEPGMLARCLDLKLGVIRILPSVSKTKDLRQITIRPNLRTWLEMYPVSEYPVVFPGLLKAVRKIRKEMELSHDVMRHTFISMHVAKFQKLGGAAWEAGNSEAIIRRHYLNLVAPCDAEKFWGIMPSGLADGCVSASTAS